MHARSRYLTPAATAAALLLAGLAGTTTLTPLAAASSASDGSESARAAASAQSAVSVSTGSVSMLSALTRFAVAAAGFSAAADTPAPASTIDHGLVLPLAAPLPTTTPATPAATTTEPRPARAVPTDAADAANANGFAFYPGTWHIKNRKLKTRLAGSQEWIESEATDVARAVLDGRGVIAEYSEASASPAYKGMSVYLYDPAAREWRLFWADGRSGRMDPPLAGRFTGGRGEFFGDDQHDGRPIKVRFRWSSTGASTAHWEQAFSADQGKTWETNWIMELTRVK